MHPECVRLPIGRLPHLNVNYPAIAFRLLVAAAWSDGELHPAEALILAQYLQRLDLGVEEKRKLLEYLQIRPAADTSRVWLEEVQAAQAQPALRRELTAALKLVVAADGRVVPEETQLIDDLRHALEASDSPSLLGRFKRWLGRLTGQAS